MEINEIIETLTEIEEKLNEVSGWARRYKIEIEIEEDVDFIRTLDGKEFERKAYKINATQTIK